MAKKLSGEISISPSLSSASPTNSPAKSPSHLHSDMGSILDECGGSNVVIAKYYDLLMRVYADDLYELPERMSSVSGDVDVKSEPIDDVSVGVIAQVSDRDDAECCELGSEELLVGDSESVLRSQESSVLDLNNEIGDGVEETEKDAMVTSVL
ncbi:hypothetical protein RND81_02G199900 [Saponaria officinalis]|uniref:Uncharacterized protein n=1 Tax=Saponaria officinalis TaxID=3572 RepID=A0AAW1MVQ8_SAPOF